MEFMKLFLSSFEEVELNDWKEIYRTKWSEAFYERLAESNSFDLDLSCFGEQRFWATNSYMYFRILTLLWRMVRFSKHNFSS